MEISFDIPTQFFQVTSKFFLVNVQNWWQVSYPKIFFRNFFGRTLTLQFWQMCHYFSEKSPRFSAQSPKNSKKQFFKAKFPQMFPLNTCIAVLAHLDSLFDTEQKKCCRSKFLTKNIVSLVKELIFRKTFLWTRGWHLWQLWKKLSE